MPTTLEFYRNLPDKQCFTCGAVIEEQHESYLIHCEQCIILESR